jgi:hypothetical protein
MKKSNLHLAEDIHWDRLNNESWQFILKEENKVILKLSWKSPFSANAKAEIGEERYFFSSAGKFFNPLICLTHENETESTCKIKFTNWYLKTSGLLEFSNNSIFSWKFDNSFNPSLIIKDQMNNTILEYKFNSNKNTEMFFNNKFNKLDSFNLLILIGWYLFPRFYLENDSTDTSKLISIIKE